MVSRGAALVFILVALTFALLLTGPAHAQTVFPPLVSGTYDLGAQAAPMEFDAEGDPLFPPTVSISLHKEEAPTAQIACVPTDAAGIVRFSLVLVNDGLRNVIRGRAHEFDDCTGLESGPSSNRAIVFFNGVGTSTLTP